MFFNIFTYSSTRGWSFDTFLGTEYGNFEAMSGVEQEWLGETYTVDYTSKPWGLGAWGAGGVLVFRMIDEADRAAFIAGAEESLNSGRYPRLKLSIYFDNVRRTRLARTPDRPTPSRLLRTHAFDPFVIGADRWQHGDDV